MVRHISACRQLLFDFKDKIVVKFTPVQSMFFTGGHDNELAAVRLANTEHVLVLAAASAGLP